MTHPKVMMFLHERDKAYVRRDVGVIRSMNVELRRLGVSDDATLEHPAGKPSRRRTTHAESDAPKSKPKLPRCEHGSVADRCPECNEELVVN